MVSLNSFFPEMPSFLSGRQKRRVVEKRDTPLSYQECF